MLSKYSWHCPAEPYPLRSELFTFSSSYDWIKQGQENVPRLKCQGAFWVFLPVPGI